MNIFTPKRKLLEEIGRLEAELKQERQRADSFIGSADHYSRVASMSEKKVRELETELARRTYTVNVFDSRSEKT